MANIREQLRERISARPHEFEEGRITHMLERQTARVPSMTYLNLAVASMLASAGIAVFARRKEFANFVGLWAPSFLLIGIYNKLVKLERTSLKRAA